MAPHTRSAARAAAATVAAPPAAAPRDAASSSATSAAAAQHRFVPLLALLTGTLLVLQNQVVTNQVPWGQHSIVVSPSTPALAPPPHLDNPTHHRHQPPLTHTGGHQPGSAGAHADTVSLHLRPVPHSAAAGALGRCPSTSPSTRGPGTQRAAAAAAAHDDAAPGGDAAGAARPGGCLLL